MRALQVLEKKELQQNDKKSFKEIPSDYFLLSRGFPITFFFLRSLLNVAGGTKKGAKTIFSWFLNLVSWWCGGGKDFFTFFMCLRPFPRRDPAFCLNKHLQIMFYNLLSSPSRWDGDGGTNTDPSMKFSLLFLPRKFSFHPLENFPIFVCITFHWMLECAGVPSTAHAAQHFYLFQVHDIDCSLNYLQLSSSWDDQQAHFWKMMSKQFR